MFRILLVAVALAASALPAGAADTTLPALLRLLPQPAPGDLRPGQVMVAYARADILAGEAGPTASPGATRLQAVTAARPMAFAHVPLAAVARWPEASGFDFDGVEALLVLEIGPMPRGVQLLAGARMPDLAALAGPLAARGFVTGQIGGQAVLRRGADYALDLRRRDAAEALGGMMGSALRHAVPAPGMLLATRGDAEMAAALAAPAAGRSLADLPEMRALVATAAGGPEARDVAQALVVTPAGGFAAPTPSLSLAPGEARRALEAELRDPDTLPGPGPWALAMLSEQRDARGIVTRLAIPYRAPADARAAAAAMAARLTAMTAFTGLLRLGEAQGLVETWAADGLHVAVLEARQPPGVERTLLDAIHRRRQNREPTPLTIGPVPRTALAR